MAIAFFFAINFSSNALTELPAFGRVTSAPSPAGSPHSPIMDSLTEHMEKMRKAWPILISLFFNQVSVFRMAELPKHTVIFPTAFWPGVLVTSWRDFWRHGFAGVRTLDLLRADLILAKNEHRSPLFSNLKWSKKRVSIKVWHLISSQRTASCSPWNKHFL